jgi:hypothetical protein
MLRLCNSDNSLSITDFSKRVKDQIHEIINDGVPTSADTSHRHLVSLDICDPLTLCVAQDILEMLQSVPRLDFIALGIENIDPDDYGLGNIIASMARVSTTVKLDLTAADRLTLSECLDRLSSEDLGGVQHLEITLWPLYYGILDEDGYHQDPAISCDWTDEAPLHPLRSFTIASPGVFDPTAFHPHMALLAHRLLRMFGPLCELTIRGQHPITPRHSEREVDTRPGVAMTKDLRDAVAKVIEQTRSARAPGWHRLARDNVV